MESNKVQNTEDLTLSVLGGLLLWLGFRDPRIPEEDYPPSQTAAINFLNFSRLVTRSVY